MNAIQIQYVDRAGEALLNHLVLRRNFSTDETFGAEVQRLVLQGVAADRIVVCKRIEADA